MWRSDLWRKTMRKHEGKHDGDGAEGRRAVTISEVAALAGVSIGTASKALNGRGLLRPETRLRVQQAAEQLGFVANAAARSLLSGRTYTVGNTTTDSIGRFSTPLMIGAEDALGAGQVSVFLCDVRADPIRAQYYLRTLLSRNVDGIIVTGRRTHARTPIATGLGVPVAYAFIASADPQDCSVMPDEADGALRAVQHLLGIGRRRIAHVTGPEPPSPGDRPRRGDRAEPRRRRPAGHLGLHHR